MFVDLVFLGDYCNLECIYCSAGRTQWRRARNRLEAVRPGGQRTSVDLDGLESGLLALIDRMASEGVIGLKLSGGEIFVRPELAVRVIEYACRAIDVVQVLTNATRPDPLAALLGRHDNLFLQVSIDGASPEANAARTRNPDKARAIVDNVARLARLAPVEVNLVLTRWNTRVLPAELDALARLGGDIVVYPFPVRVDGEVDASGGIPGPFLPAARDRATLAAGVADLVGIDRVLDGYDRWAHLLPGRAYIEALRAFYVHGNRRGDCAIPRGITGVDQDGRQAVCACGDIAPLGSVPTDGMRTPAPGAIWGRPCSGCFTHYEILHCVDDAREVRHGFTRRLVEHYLAGVRAT